MFTSFFHSDSHKSFTENQNCRCDNYLDLLSTSSLGIFENGLNVAEVWLENTDTAMLEAKLDAIDINVLGDTEANKENF